ncbi:MAG: hypothetical protein JEY97_14840 [Bacteroidales bacterium]|nr:hypothetical protein [Bacteroidales bacterium]
MIKVAYIQFAPVLNDLNSTIKNLEPLLENVSNAKLVVLPELSNSGYNFKNKKQAFHTAESIESGTFTNFLIEKCKQYNFHIVSGINEIEDGKLFNSAILVNSGGCIGKYRKIHLFMNEKKYFHHGNELPVFDLGFCKIGILICFDHFFPEAWRILALKGAQIICHPSNLVTNLAFKTLPAHALMNKFNIITANRIGREGDLTFTGKSSIFNPFGEVICQASIDNEEATLFEIEPNTADNKMITPRNDIFKDRKPEIYAKYLNNV